MSSYTVGTILNTSVNAEDGEIVGFDTNYYVEVVAFKKKAIKMSNLPKNVDVIYYPHVIKKYLDLLTINQN